MSSLDGVDADAGQLILRSVCCVVTQYTLDIKIRFMLFTAL